MHCQQFRELADSFLVDELSVETNHAVISHLEHCPECRRELAARRGLRTKLREAFVHAPENQMRPEFADRLRKQLHAHALDKSAYSVVSPGRSSAKLRRTSWLVLAACLILAVAIGLALVRHRSRQERAAIPLDFVKTELAKSAVGDHRDCAIHFRLAEKPINLEVAAREYDPVYLDLTRAVSAQLHTPLDAQFVEAHSCVFEGRRFAHIVLKYHGRLVSLLVTGDGRPGETREVTPSALAEQQVIPCSQFDGYQVSCFQTTRHAIFVVSELSEAENLALARALAPSVYAHIMSSEGAA